MFEFEITQHWFSQGYGSAQIERDRMAENGFAYLVTIEDSNSTRKHIYVKHKSDELEKLKETLKFEQANLDHCSKINGDLRKRIKELEKNEQTTN